MEKKMKSAEQKVMWLILEKVSAWDGGIAISYDDATGDDIVAAYEELVEQDNHWDAKNEIRSGEVETGLPCPYSRHYESKAVASRLPDGSWVGWVYWYGGGKHGEPEAMDWIEDAYNLTVTETEQTVIVRKFDVVPD